MKISLPGIVFLNLYIYFKKQLVVRIQPHSKGHIMQNQLILNIFFINRTLWPVV